MRLEGKGHMTHDTNLCVREGGGGRRRGEEERGAVYMSLKDVLVLLHFCSFFVYPVFWRMRELYVRKMMHCEGSLGSGDAY